MVGDTLGHSRIEARLGAGGMGVVYRAHDERLHRAVFPDGRRLVITNAAHVSDEIWLQQPAKK